MARRGRPRGANGDETRRRIIEAARDVFARHGFAATSVASLASAADLAPSAIYHYFAGKAELYEAVFEETVEAIWTDLGGSARSRSTLHDAIVAVIDDSRNLAETRPGHSDFLALVPMEARLNREFSHLLERRSKYQDETFGHLAELGISTGAIVRLTHGEATEILRALIMGWFFERHFRQAEIPGSGEAVVALIAALGN